MKATNIYQSLKTAGYCGGKSSNPELPGVSAAKYSTNNPPKGDKNKTREVIADEINVTSFDAKTGKGTRERILPSGKKVRSSFEVKPEKSSKEDSMANYGTALKKKSCAKFIPEEADRRKPKTRRPGKTRRRVTTMLQGLTNSGRGCKRNPY